MKYDLSTYNIHVGNTQLSRIGNDCFETSKFIGMYIDENLTWKMHMIQTNKRVSRALFSIKPVTNTLPLESLRTLPSSYMLRHPHLLYGIIAWESADKSIIRQTHLSQIRAIRVLTNSACNSHTDTKVRERGILKLNYLFEYQYILFMCNRISFNTQ